MATANTAAKKAKTEAARVVTDNPWIDRLARFGFIMRGVLYIVIGLLAVQLALGAGGKATDQNGAIALLAANPWGKFLLFAMAIGLAGYSLWGFVRAIFDPLRRGHDTKGLVARLGFLISGVSYGALVLPTARYLTGNPGSGGGQSGNPQDITAQLLSKPGYGQWLVILFGGFWIVAAIGQFLQAYKAEFVKDFKSREMRANEKRWATRIGRFGYAARGVVFAIIGWFVIQAALSFSPQRATGFDGALLKIAREPYGLYLLAIVALGLVAFGVYSMLCARWNKVV